MGAPQKTSIWSIASEKPALTSFPPLATLVASLCPGFWEPQLRYTPLLCPSSSTADDRLTTPIFLPPALSPPCPLLPTPLSRCPSDILHVAVLSNPIFPCSIPRNRFSSMPSGVAIGRPTQNMTIEAPYGTTNHGDPNSLCVPATWAEIASFLLFNYVAHGATVVSYSGEAAFDTLLSVVAAILFPTSGIIRALNFIVRRPLLTAVDDLEVAARSGALCMLVRSSSWKPQTGDNIRDALIKYPGNEHSLRGPNTSSLDPSANIAPTYVPIYSYSRPIILTNIFSLISKYCRLVDLQAAEAQ